MTINAHAEAFAGKPVRAYDPRVGLLLPHMPRREFRFTEGSSNKFWAIELDGKRHTVQYGKIGTAGQAQTKDFKNEEEALKAYDKLVREKVGKGYVPAEAETPSKPAKKSAGGELPYAVRVGLDYEDFEGGAALTERLAALLDDPGAAQVTALVIGCWGFEGQDNAAVVEALVAGRAKLPALRALFLGDIVVEEQEISWINQTDVSPLFEAFPKLEAFQIRGGNGLRLGSVGHKKLKTLVIESGGLPAEVVREVAAARLPALEHLELWLGEEDYGGNATPDDLRPVLAGKQFPKLRYLGLRDSARADAFAAAVADAPVLNKLEVLDLSLGNLGDGGAEALAGSGRMKKLKRLDIHHHFVSEPAVKKLKALGIEVDARERKEPYDFDPDYRYIAVSE